jgi:2-oxoglutarate ferredoxin oxidoreductase subunit alpha
MNAAALKTNIKYVKKGGKIIVNTDGFDSKNLRLANYPDGVNPIENGSSGRFRRDHDGRNQNDS